MLAMRPLSVSANWGVDAPVNHEEHSSCDHYPDVSWGVKLDELATTEIMVWHAGHLHRLSWGVSDRLTGVSRSCPGSEYTVGYTSVEIPDWGVTLRLGGVLNSI